MKCMAPEFIVSGTVESGKTNPMLHRLYQLHCAIPKLRTFICRKHRVDMRNSVLDQFENEVLPYPPDYPNSPCRVSGARSPHEYLWKNGGITSIFGVHEKSSVLGNQFDCGYVCQAEQLDQADWEFLAHRCSRAGNWIIDGQRFGQIWGDANPDVAHHWIPNRKSLKHFTVSFKDNILFYKDGKWTDWGKKRTDLLRRTITGVRHRRLVLGEWCSAEGLVFPEFDSNIHVIDTLPHDIEDWQFLIGIDYGYTSPFVACWFAYDKRTDTLISVQEWRRVETLIDDHIDAIKRLSKNRNIICRISDHDSQMNHQLAQGGIPTRNANKKHGSEKGSILRGLDLMRIRLRNRKLLLYRHQLIERDPLLEDRHAIRDGIEEMQGYMHKPVEKHTGDSTTDDIPIKGDDHWIDVCRYVVDYLDNRIELSIPTTIAKPDRSKWSSW